jgi:hypothetical protein
MSVQGLQNPLERLSVLPTTVNWRGDWDSATVYFKNDIAVSPANGGSYILTGATSVTNSTDPSTDPLWTELSGLSTGVQAVNGLPPGIAVDNTNPLQPIISNTGVLTITGGAAVLVSGPNETPTISSSAITQLGEGAGISIAGPSATPIVTNTGVLQVIDGPGIAVTAPTGIVTISNLGVVQVVAGAGIGVDVTNPQVPVISNTGVVSLTVGPGLQSTGGLTPTISNIGVLSVAAADPSITVTGTLQNPLLSTDAPTISLFSASTNYSGAPPVNPGTTAQFSLFGVPANEFSQYVLNGAPNPSGIFMIDMTTISFMFELAGANPTVTSSPYYLSFEDTVTPGGPFFYTPTVFPAEYFLSLGQSYPITAFLGQVYFNVAAARATGMRVCSNFRITNGTNARMKITSSGGIYAVYYPNGIE